MCIDLTNEGFGSIFKRKDGKHFVYVPLPVAEDTSFPIELTESKKVKVSFKGGEKRIVVKEL